ncbi:MAG TPA: diguanylate cyclase [Solidesulfovibrio magneticus]|nr:diguanylate cyclase [Solidesulfovibrio magneticus]
MGVLRPGLAGRAAHGLPERGVLAFALLVWLSCLGLLACLAGPARAELADFSPEERAYIRDLGPVTVCVDPDWPPFERLNARGQYEGVGADLFRLAAEVAGLRYRIVPTADWDESVAASKDGRCRLLAFLNRTPAREQWLLFTAPLFTDANVFITREEHFFIADPAELTGETIVFPSGTSMEERVRRDYPNLRVLNSASEREALDMVSERQADMTLRSLIVAAYAIKKEGLFNLKIAGKLPGYDNALRIGVSKDMPRLRDILDKAVRTITPAEREEIVNRHVSINVETVTDYGLIGRIAAGFACIVAIIVAWNLRINKLNDELERRSRTDPLTGLANRTHLDAVLRQEADRAERYGRPFAVILFDVDHFKAVNDVHGHLAGDKVLQTLADTARATVRGCDLVGRWGGEEFLVLCPETDADAALILAERLRVAVREQPFETGHVQTVSLGVAAFVSGDSVDSLLIRADGAMYRAKNAGRGRAMVA